MCGFLLSRCWSGWTRGEPLGNRPYGRHAGFVVSPVADDVRSLVVPRWSSLALFGRDYVNPGSRCRSCEFGIVGEQLVDAEAESSCQVDGVVGPQGSVGAG